jgi:hypothetical protein
VEDELTAELVRQEDWGRMICYQPSMEATVGPVLAKIEYP